MKTHHCQQWRRYLTRFGQIVIHRELRNVAAVIPSATPCVSIKLTRGQAAIGLRQWRGAR